MINDYSGRPMNIVMDGDKFKIEPLKSSAGEGGPEINAESSRARLDDEFYLDLVLYKVSTPTSD